jgi:hypothetical protein
MATEADKQTSVRREGRSPAYPFFTVEKALGRAAQLHRQEASHWAPLASAMAAWGYSPKSSGGRQTLATMRYYALIDVAGEGDARRIRVSEIAKRILLDEREDQSEKRALIREVALSPSAHKALYEEYKTGLASDGTMLHFLMWEKHYNKDAARDLLEEYKETASYAGLYEPQKTVDKEGGKGDTGGDENGLSVVAVGDTIQWTSQGADQFPEGAKVLGLSEDGQWVFTDQSTSGLPLKEVSVMEAATPAPPAATPPQVPAHLLARVKEEQPKPGSRKAVFPLKEGDVALIFPEGLSEAGLKDLGAYLQIFLSQEAREAKAKG